jgi:hypothetical protein
MKKTVQITNPVQKSTTIFPKNTDLNCRGSNLFNGIIPQFSLKKQTSIDAKLYHMFSTSNQNQILKTETQNKMNYETRV